MSALLTYAYDQDGNLVYIDDVINGNDCGCICPSCKKPLQARNEGKIRTHHFAHQADVDCPNAYETMLHLLAKEKIQKVFYSQDEFNIEFEYQSYCTNKKECHYVTYGDCVTSKYVKYNLKQYYDSCEQEIPYDKVTRRSDLKIWLSTHPERKPVYIEIIVNRQGTTKKLHSDGKTIEMKIENEGDIENIVLTGLIEDKNVKFDIYGNKIDNHNPKISFFGFKKEDYDNADISPEIVFFRYILYRSGKFICFQDSCQCKELKRMRYNALCEMCFHIFDTFDIPELAKWIGFQKFGIKNCLMCKNYVESYSGIGRICRKYKYLGLDKYEKHDTAKANDCQFFELNVEEMNDNLCKVDNNLIYQITEL